MKLNNTRYTYSCIHNSAKDGSAERIFFFGSDDLVTPQMEVIDANNLQTNKYNYR